MNVNIWYLCCRIRKKTSDFFKDSLTPLTCLVASYHWCIQWGLEAIQKDFVRQQIMQKWHTQWFDKVTPIEFVWQKDMQKWWRFTEMEIGADLVWLDKGGQFWESFWSIGVHEMCTKLVSWVWQKITHFGHKTHDNLLKKRGIWLLDKE